MHILYNTMCMCLSPQAIWLATAVDGGVQLSHTSPDGDQGYPGEVQVSVSYTLQVTSTCHIDFVVALNLENFVRLDT